MWACALSLLMISGKYNHIQLLQTKTLKKIQKDANKSSEAVIEEFK